MPRDTHWRHLIPGLIATAALAVIAVCVLVFARVGALHGNVMRLYAPTSQARGVLVGTEVWLAGQKIGRVADVRFAPVTADTSRRLVIVLDVLARYAEFLRRDSYAQVRTGSSLIGAPVLFITIGTPHAPRIRDEDTLATRPQSDAEHMTGRFAEASQSFPAIIENVKLLNTQLMAARGTVGAFLAPGEGMQRVSNVAGNASGLLGRATSGHGTVALVLRGSLQSRVAGVRARADSVSRLLSSNDASFGRFRRDSTLLRTVAGLRAETDSIAALLATSRGTAGRVLHDGALLQEVAAAQRQIADIIADLSAHPFRYSPF